MDYGEEQTSFLSEGLKLEGFLYSPKPKNAYFGVLFIHGGDNYLDNRYGLWQKYLAERGFSSFSYHSRGVGGSEGKWEEGTLANRLTDAQNALNFFAESGKVDENNLTIIGSSMGAHVACRLSETIIPISVLILQSAAAYALEAENIPFGPQFSQLIRTENSFQNSPAFTAFAKFKRAKGVVYGSEDKVISKEIQKRYQSLLEEEDLNELIPGGKHALLKPETVMDEQCRKTLFTKTLAFISSCL